MASIFNSSQVCRNLLQWVCQVPERTPDDCVSSFSLSFVFQLLDGKTDAAYQCRIVPSTNRIASGEFLHILNFEDGTAIFRFPSALGEKCATTRATYLEAHVHVVFVTVMSPTWC